MKLKNVQSYFIYFICSISFCVKFAKWVVTCRSRSLEDEDESTHIEQMENLPSSLILFGEKKMTGTLFYVPVNVM